MNHSLSKLLSAFHPYKAYSGNFKSIEMSKANAQIMKNNNLF